MTDIYEELRSKIASETVKITVIGLGYIGLPLALEFSKQFEVYGYDSSKSIIADLEKGISTIQQIENNSIKMALEDSFTPTSDETVMKDSDFIIICVPTPLKEDKTPELKFIKSAANTISNNLKMGQFIILESTTFPGTTEDYLKVWLEKSSGLIAGNDFGLAFSPERIDPGNKNYGIRNTPKIVGGLGSEDTEVAAMLYETIVEVGVVKVSDSRTAEAAKLMENIFRHVNIALVNEMALVMEKMDIDIREVIEAASTKPFGYMPFYPGPGVGGHCIPLDPYYLSFAAKQKGIRPRFIELSGEINEYMKIHTVNLIEEGLKRMDASIRNSVVGVMGLAYKRDVDDTRESPAIDIIVNLVERGAEIKVYDPYVKEIKTKAGLFKSEKDLTSLFMGVDAVVIITGHTEFKNQKYGTLTKHMKRKIIVDACRILPQFKEGDTLLLAI